MLNLPGVPGVPVLIGGGIAQWRGAVCPPIALRAPPEDICDPKKRESQRTLSVASPIIARMRLMIQKRMTI